MGCKYGVLIIVLSTLNFEIPRYNSGVIPRGNPKNPVMFSG